MRFLSVYQCSWLLWYRDGLVEMCPEVVSSTGKMGANTPV